MVRARIGGLLVGRGMGGLEFLGPIQTVQFLLMTVASIQELLMFRETTQNT